MKKICIIGWYGTETLGDRAILSGILKLLKEKYGNIEVLLGSLYPFFTERTFYEESILFKAILKENRMSLFDLKNNEILKASIKQSDLVVMGGGPIMELHELKYIKEAFSYAKRKHKKTLMMGCGISEIKTRGFIKIVDNIIENCDLLILRNKISYENLSSSLRLIGKKPDRKKIVISMDPAILALEEAFYQQGRSENYAVVNLRDFSFTVTDMKYQEEIEKKIKRMIAQLSSLVERVFLISNHTFCVGGDDRDYFYKLSLSEISDNIEILDRPLNLEETFTIIRKAALCVGMRYHAILFQMILNQNNYIIDYTDKEKGKVCALLKNIQDRDMCYERYRNIFEWKEPFVFERQNRQTRYGHLFERLRGEYMEAMRDLK